MAFPDGTADFRSDTVTRPTTEMRRAMAEAEVGDDVYGEDPTVNRLEEAAAEVMGTEAALFVPSGTMGNQLAINTHTRPGDEVVCVRGAHVRNFEHGAGPALSGIAFRTIATPDGVITPEALSDAIHPSRRLPAATLLVWENTHNLSGGTVVPIEIMTETSRVARQAAMAIHLDGARIFNAALAAGREAAEYARLADTVQFCFSKGLGAPIGSVLCGNADLVAEARERRARFGGGMRQVGVVAAAALVALRDRGRLGEDHELARRLAQGLADRFPKAVDPAAVETNMVMVEADGTPWEAPELVDRLDAAGVKVGLMAPGLLRFVTHRDVDQSDVDRTLAALDRPS